MTPPLDIFQPLQHVSPGRCYVDTHTQGLHLQERPSAVGVGDTLHAHAHALGPGIPYCTTMRMRMRIVCAVLGAHAPE